MKAAAGQILVVSMLVWSSLGEAKELFFHWATVDSNRELLTRGGYPTDGGHSSDLSHGGHAEFNAQVFSQARDWYLSSREVDAAGAGFYMSHDLFDSSSYGPDLLIVEADGIDAQKDIPFDPQIKAKSDLALKKDGLAGLPAITRYYAGSNWHVFSRPLTDAEKARWSIRFRPPNAGDVDLIWSRIPDSDYEAKLSFLSNIAKLVANQKKTRSTEILFHRILFDKAHAFVLAMPPLTESGGNSREIDEFENILNAYLRHIPGDPRTRQLTIRWLDSMKQRGLDPILDTRHFEELFRSLTEQERAPFNEWVIRSVKKEIQRPDFGTERLGRSLELFDLTASHMSSKEREALADRIAGVAGTSEGAKLGFERIQPVLERHASRETYAKYVVGAVDMVLSKPLVVFPGQSYIRKLSDAQAKVGTLLRMGRGKDGVVFDTLADKLLRRFAQSGHKEEAEKSGAFGFFMLVQEAYAVPDENDRNALIALIRDKTLKLDPNLEKSKGFGHQFTALLARGVPAHDFESFVRKLMNDFPFLIPAIRDGLHKAGGGSPPGDGPSVAWSDLERYATQAARASSGLGPEIEGHYRRVKSNYFEKNGAPDAGQFESRMSKALLNIPGSLEYSEISRTFLLVDPILLSEDLRVKNAKMPQHRFNEEYVDGSGRRMEQPAWQNFNKAFDDFAADLQFEPFYRDPVDFNFQLETLNARLVQTHVDGSSRGGSVIWDRKKYDIFAPEKAWTEASPEARRDLSRYFSVSRDSSGYHLRFKGMAELAKTLPGLGRYAPRDYLHRNPGALPMFIKQEAAKLKDPVQKAARILHLFTKLHPYENGNGRQARLWAAQVLVQAGLPIPVGLPTNDFFMSQRHIELEVRKAVRLGRFWEDMLKKAVVEGVPTDQFFQKVYRGSALEGLVQMSPSSTQDLERHVAWLETLSAPPAWTTRLAQSMDQQIDDLRRKHGSIAHVPEYERGVFQDELWKAAEAQHASEFRAAPQLSRKRCGLVDVLDAVR